MRETDFIKQNKEKWGELEQDLGRDRNDPHKLSRLFVQLTDDLSFSRTHYPNRSVKVYLNNLTQQIFYRIYKKQGQGWKKFVLFWTEELPAILYLSRRELGLAFVIFLLTFCIGIFSSRQDNGFSRVILGDSYVEMTLENIRNGDPMGVYKKMKETDMFLGITINNLRVAFMTFVLGAFFCVGSVAMLLYNGIMVGSFQYFFFERGLFKESFLTIWMHGTLEISAIIIAAAAGLTLGRGLVFPGTYTRLQAFRLSAQRGIKIMIGVTPVFILAAFIEGFITRYTDAPDSVRLALILLSAAFILTYFVWLPFSVGRKGASRLQKDAELHPSPPHHIRLGEIKDNGELFGDMIAVLSGNFRRIALACTGLATLYTLGISFFERGPLENFLYNRTLNFIWFFHYEESPQLYILNTLLFAGASTTGILALSRHLGTLERKKSWTRTFVHSLFLVGTLGVVLFAGSWAGVMLFALLLPLFTMTGFVAFYEGRNMIDCFSRAFSLMGNSFFPIAGLYVSLFIIGGLGFFLLSSPFLYFYMDIFRWAFLVDPETLDLGLKLFYTLLVFLYFGLIAAAVVIINGLTYFSLAEAQEGTTLKTQIQALATKIKS
jgi:uncharacterized membrane protein SpoIIM required for sporulation